MALVVLSNVSCSNGTSEKVSKFCKKYPEKLNVLMSDVTDEFDFGNIFNEENCETLFENLSFCESELIDMISAASDCDVIESECDTLSDGKWDACDAMDDLCYSNYISCDSNLDCYNEYSECQDNVDKCYDELYKNYEDEECYERADECYEKNKLGNKILKAFLCVDSNYSPSNSLDKFCNSQASACGFEDAAECMNYLQDSFTEYGDDSLTTESLNAIASLASCGLQYSNIQCSDLFQLMNEENLDEFNESEIESMITQVSNIFFHCPDDLIGVAISFLEF